MSAQADSTSSRGGQEVLMGKYKTRARSEQVSPCCPLPELVVYSYHASEAAFRLLSAQETKDLTLSVNPC